MISDLSEMKCQIEVFTLFMVQKYYLILIISANYILLYYKHKLKLIMQNLKLVLIFSSLVKLFLRQLEFLAGVKVLLSWSGIFGGGQKHFLDGILSTPAKNSLLLQMQRVSGTVAVKTLNLN